MKKYNIPNIDILKIDVEGATYDLFLIKNNFILIDITFCEITPNNYQSDSVWINNNIL